MAHTVAIACTLHTAAHRRSWPGITSPTSRQDESVTRLQCRPVNDGHGLVVSVGKGAFDTPRGEVTPRPMPPSPPRVPARTACAAALSF
jgi:hypothetical protein